MTAEKTYTSKYSVLRKAARHAKRNIEKYGRPVPKINQLRKKLEKEPITPSPRQTTGHRTTHPSPSHTTLPTITQDSTITNPKDTAMPSASHTRGHRTRHPSLRPTKLLKTVVQGENITSSPTSAQKDSAMPSASYTRRYRTTMPTARPTTLPKITQGSSTEH